MEAAGKPRTDQIICIWELYEARLASARLTKFRRTPPRGFPCARGAIRLRTISEHTRHRATTVQHP